MQLLSNQAQKVEQKDNKMERPPPPIPWGLSAPRPWPSRAPSEKNQVEQEEDKKTKQKEDTEKPGVKASVCLDPDTPDDEEQNEKDMAVDHRQKEGDEKKKKKEQVEQEKDQRTKVEKDKDPPEALQKREAQANRADTSIVTLCWTLLEFLTYVLRETWIVRSSEYHATEQAKSQKNSISDRYSPGRDNYDSDEEVLAGNCCNERKKGRTASKDWGGPTTGSDTDRTFLTDDPKRGSKPRSRSNSYENVVINPQQLRGRKRSRKGEDPKQNAPDQAQSSGHATEQTQSQRHDEDCGNIVFDTIASVTFFEQTFYDVPALLLHKQMWDIMSRNKEGLAKENMFIEWCRRVQRHIEAASTASPSTDTEHVFNQFLLHLPFRREAPSKAKLQSMLQDLMTWHASLLQSILDRPNHPGRSNARIPAALDQTEWRMHRREQKEQVEQEQDQRTKVEKDKDHKKTKEKVKKEKDQRKKVEKEKDHKEEKEKEKDKVGISSSTTISSPTRSSSSTGILKETVEHQAQKKQKMVQVLKASVCLDPDTLDDEEQFEKDMAVDHLQKERDEKKKKKEQVEQEKDQRMKVEKDKDFKKTKEKVEKVKDQRKKVEKEKECAVICPSICDTCFAATKWKMSSELPSNQRNQWDPSKAAQRLPMTHEEVEAKRAASAPPAASTPPAASAPLAASAPPKPSQAPSFLRAAAPTPATSSTLPTPEADHEEADHGEADGADAGDEAGHEEVAAGDEASAAETARGEEPPRKKRRRKRKHNVPKAVLH